MWSACTVNWGAEIIPDEVIEERRREYEPTLVGRDTTDEVLAKRPKKFEFEDVEEDST